MEHSKAVKFWFFYLFLFNVAKPTGEGKLSALKIELKKNGVSIQVRHGDMTEEIVDCIVNAANSSLDHSSGLAGSIVKKG